MALLSIIVPVYNKENYIDACIKSILSQSFKDFELILVNDGSTDNSGLKCHQHKDLDSRIRVIDQPNAGVSAARNTGVFEAKGTYIGFIDSDDTIEPDMYDLLIKNALNFNACISVCSMHTIFPYKTISRSEIPGPVNFNHHEALCACLKGDFDRSANNKIYKATIVKDIKFEGEIYEDILYTCRAFISAQKTVFENVIKYNYIVRDNSVSMSLFNLKYMQTIAITAKVIDLVTENDKKCISYAQALDILANISLLNLLLLAGKNKYIERYNQVVSNLKIYSTFIIQNRNVAKKYKYAVKLFFLSPAIYTSLIYIYGRLTNAEMIKRTA